MTSYILCLDTDSYAGNFERQVTAYATGVVGECGVGDEEAKEFFAETDGVADSILDEFSNKIEQRVDDDDRCSRPCSIQPTPGWVNDGIGNHYRHPVDASPTDEQIAKYQEGLRERKMLTGDETPSWFPAYYSVGIFLNAPLSEDALNFVVNRARKFLAAGRASRYAPTPITIERVRLVTETTQAETAVLG